MKRYLFFLTVLLFLPSLASGYYERLEVGGKALSMGKAYHALADDPSAVYWNPAGLAWQNRPAALLMHYRPFVVQDLAANFISVSHPIPLGTAGFGWHHTGLSDVISEDLFSLSLAKEIDIPKLGSMGVGGTAKILRVSYHAFEDPDTGTEIDYGAQNKFAADIGILYRFTDKIRAGAIARNLGEPHFDFVAGGGGTRLVTTLEGSVSYLWNPESVVSLGLVRDHRDELSPSVGAEVVFYDVFALRSGLFDQEFWGGFGILSAAWTLDAGFVTHKALGVSYMASVTVPFGRER